MWWVLLVLFGVLSAQPSNNTSNDDELGTANMTDFFNIKSVVYYFPGVIGAHPLRGDERVYSDRFPLYTRKFEAIHDRDLDWLAQVVDTIQMSGFIPFPYVNNTYFLDKAHSKGLRVIASFSMRRYRYSTLADQRTFQAVVDDFIEFVKPLQNHPAVIAVCLGDIDDEWAELESTNPTSPIRPLLSTLIEISKRELLGIPVTTALVYDSVDSILLLSLMKALDFDFWIFNAARSTGPHMIDTFQTYPDTNRPSLLQISESAWNQNQARGDPEQQGRFYARILDFVAAQRLKTNQIIAPIFFEWTDQWWRAPRRANCIYDAPYGQSSCGVIKAFLSSEPSAYDAVERNGLTSQFDKIPALHCIQARVSLLQIANFSNRSVDFDTDSISCARLTWTNWVSSLTYWLSSLPMLCLMIGGTIAGFSRGKAKFNKCKCPRDKSQNAGQKNMTYYGLRDEQWQMYYEAHQRCAKKAVNAFLGREQSILKASLPPPDLTLTTQDFAKHERAEQERICLQAAKTLVDRLLHVYLLQHPEVRTFLANLSGPNKLQINDLTEICIVYRTIWSLAEQTAYCPTVINNIFHSLMLNENKDNNTIKLEELHAGLDSLEQQQVRRRCLCCFANKINYDDIEDQALATINTSSVNFRIPNSDHLKVSRDDSVRIAAIEKEEEKKAGGKKSEGVAAAVELVGNSVAAAVELVGNNGAVVGGYNTLDDRKDDLAPGDNDFVGDEGENKNQLVEENDNKHQEVAEKKTVPRLFGAKLSDKAPKCGPVESSFLEFTSFFVLLDFLWHYRMNLYLKIWLLGSAYYVANHQYSLSPLSLTQTELDNFQVMWHQWGGFSPFFVLVDVYLRFGCELILMLFSLRRRDSRKCGCTALANMNPVVSSGIILACSYIPGARTMGVLFLLRVIEASYLVLVRTIQDRRRRGPPASPWYSSERMRPQIRKFLFWTAVFAMSWCLEAFVLSAMVRNFNTATVCQKGSESCLGECLTNWTTMCSTQCIACKAGVYMIYLLMFLGVLLDTHLAFSMVLTAAGYYVGIKEQGASGVYYADEPISWEEVSSKIGNAFPEVALPDTNPAMFAANKRVRELWKAIINDLRRRHLMSRAQSDKLQLDSDAKLNVRLLGLGSEAQERLLFFYHSLKAVAVRRKQQGGTIETLTLSITTYEEAVLRTSKQLREAHGNKTEIEHLIANKRDEWQYACEDFCERGLVRGTSEEILDLFVCGEGGRELEWEVQKWASYRQQTVARTIRGCMNYFEAVRFLKRSDELIEIDGELLVSHQTYGLIPKWSPLPGPAIDWLDRMEGIDRIFEEYKESASSMSLIFDYEYNANEKECPYRKDYKTPETPTEKRVRIKYELLRGLFEAFLDKGRGQWDFDCCKFSVRARFDKVENKIAIYDVIPRQWNLKILGSQGKSANHLNMLRFATGHFVQVNDANMDLWLGEAFKFPTICNMFTENNSRNPRCRIIGFREYVYTQTSGATGKFMGQSEFVFGTIVSRAMQFLGGRLHYGHPDFFDLMWAYATGGLSKASAGINTSEDIFAGFTVLLRESGKMIEVTDLLEGQKGREEVFLKATDFLSKISSGFVTMQSSRDLYRLSDRLPIFDSLSLYYGTSGYYVSNILVDLSLYTFLLSFVFLSLGGVSVHDLGAVGSSLGSEWLITAGVLSLLPLLFELVLEYGMVKGVAKLLSGILVLRNAMIFHVFQNKVVSSSVMAAVLSGTSGWINTGRPSFFQHFTKCEAYKSYAGSTYMSGIELLILYSLYYQFTDPSGGTHPMYFPIAAAIVWLLAPAVFTPQLGEYQKLKEDVYESFSWLTRDIAQVSKSHKKTEKGESFNSYWWEMNNTRSNGATVFYLFATAMFNFVMVTIIYTSYVDTFMIYLPILVMHFFTTFLWIFNQGGSLLTSAYLGAPILSLLLLVSFVVPYSFGEWWVGLVMLLLAGSLAKNVILASVMLFSFVFNSKIDSVRLSLDRYLFFASFQFYFKFGIALFVMTGQVALSFALLCLIWPYEYLRKFFLRSSRVAPSLRKVVPVEEKTPIA